MLELVQELDNTDEAIKCSMIVNDLGILIDKYVGKQLVLHDVSQQRELLNSFADAWNMPENTKDEYVFERDINTFLKDKTIL